MIPPLVTYENQCNCSLINFFSSDVYIHHELMLNIDYVNAQYVDIEFSEGFTKTAKELKRHFRSDLKTPR